MTDVDKVIRQAVEYGVIIGARDAGKPLPGGKITDPKTVEAVDRMTDLLVKRLARSTVTT